MYDNFSTIHSWSVVGLLQLQNTSFPTGYVVVVIKIYLRDSVCDNIKTLTINNILLAFCYPTFSRYKM